MSQDRNTQMSNITSIWIVSEILISAMLKKCGFWKKTQIDGP